MLTCNRYINLLVFYHLNQQFMNNNLAYLMDKYKLIFKITPNKILISDIDHIFISNILEQYKDRWHYAHLTDDSIKVLYFCYLINNKVMKHSSYSSISDYYFSYYTKVYNKFYFTYESIVETNMMVLLHENLREDIRNSLGYEDFIEKYKFLWLSEKLNKLKNV